MNDFVVTVNNNKMPVSLPGTGKVKIAGKEYSCELLHLSGNAYILRLENKFFNISAERINNGNYTLIISGNRFDAVVRTSLQERAGQLLQKSDSIKKQVEVKAPMPGMILKIKKHAGETIAKGETILILEAMKMENDLHAPKAGFIKDIFIGEGTAVEKGTVLFSIV